MEKSIKEDSSWTTFLEKYSETLTSSPYLTLLFLSGVLVILAVFYPANKFFSIALLLYSIAGLFWRQIIKDLRVLLDIGSDKKRSKSCWQNWLVTITYHGGNIVLFWILLKYLKVF